MAWSTQVHGAAVLVVDGPGPQGEADALVSRTGEHVLLVSVADCCPILLWDSAGQATAVAHAGWRGVVAGVLSQTVAALAGAGCPPQRIRAWIGPSIGVEHFEVGEEVAARFDPLFVRRDKTKPHVDLKAAAVAQLSGAGVVSRSIEVCPDDTYARSELYWSFRRDKGICGRHVGYIVRP
jgi:YfiH family protein